MAFGAYDLLKLVEEHGQSLTLHKKAYGAYDPATSTVGSTTTTDTTITGYFYNYELGVSDLNNIQSGMRKCLISALGLTVVPDTEDEISGSGNKVHITNVVTMYSGSQVLCYICDVRE